MHSLPLTHLPLTLLTHYFQLISKRTNEFWAIGRLGDWAIGRLGHCQIARLPDCQIARLPDCQIARLPDCQIARLPDCQIHVQMLNYRFFRMGNSIAIFSELDNAFLTPYPLTSYLTYPLFSTDF